MGKPPVYEILYLLPPVFPGGKQKTRYYYTLNDWEFQSWMRGAIINLVSAVICFLAAGRSTNSKCMRGSIDRDLR